MIFVILCRAALLDAETGQVVLAGDPKQLGPILRSPFALKYGMGKYRCANTLILLTDAKTEH